MSASDHAPEPELAEARRERSGGSHTDAEASGRASGPGHQHALDDLIELLNLETLEVNLFRGRSPEEWRQRVFGGQVAGQALVASGRTVDPVRALHSCHA